MFHLMEILTPQRWQIAGAPAAAQPAASTRRPALHRWPPAYAAASATHGRYRMAAAARPAAGGSWFCRLGPSEANMPGRLRVPRLPRRRDETRFRQLLPPGGAVASTAGEGKTAGGDERGTRRRPRFLCLHGFRTSGEIMRQQVTGRWPAEVTSRLDLVFPDAPFPAEGASPVAGVFNPPYFEWCQFVGEDFLRCRNLDRCFAYVEELMIREGPFDGLLGFSQGAGISAVLAGLQEQGLALAGVAKVRYVIAIAGAKIRSPAAAVKAFAATIKCPSLHFIGDDDFVKVHSEELVEAFADPLVIRHPCGHTVPRLDEKGLQVMFRYLDKIQSELLDMRSN